MQREKNTLKPSYYGHITVSATTTPSSSSRTSPQVTQILLPSLPPRNLCTIYNSQMQIRNMLLFMYGHYSLMLFFFIVLSFQCQFHFVKLCFHLFMYVSMCKDLFLKKNKNNVDKLFIKFFIKLGFCQLDQCLIVFRDLHEASVMF